MEHDAEGGSGGQVQEAELGRGVPGDAETARDLADEVRHQVGPVRPFLLSADGHRIDGVRRLNPQAHGGFGQAGNVRSWCWLYGPTCNASSTDACPAALLGRQPA